MLLSLVVVFISVLLLLMSVAFVTLLERVLLALTQLRKGPSKVLVGGVVQPLIDGVKLLIKGQQVPSQSFHVLLLVGPILVLMGMSVVWASFSSMPFHSSLWLNSLLFVLVLSLGVYGVLLVGLSSVSKYGLMGSMRACVQSVSYEVSFIFIVLSLILLGHHTSFISSSAVMMGCLPFWLISYVAEVNRAPMDLAEGESELISGFNIELSSVLFAYVLVGEYGMVVCLSWFTSVMLFSGSWVSMVGWVMMSLIIRSVFPRLRYDKLMLLCWMCVLPLSIGWEMVSLSLSLS